MQVAQIYANSRYIKVETSEMQARVESIRVNCFTRKLSENKSTNGNGKRE